MNKAYKYLYLLFIPFFSLLACITIFFRNGWPVNHSGNSIFTISKFYYNLIINNHTLFPMWTVYGNHGLGSPLPFFYHRLFFYLTTVINLGVNDLLLSVKLSILLLLFTGGTTVYILIKKIFNNRFYGIAGSGLFIFSNYLYMDWLVRGAAAEFTALVIIPWILLGFFQTAESFKKRYFLFLGFCFSLLMYAHSIIFIFSFFIWIFFFIIYWKEWKKIIPGMLVFIIPLIIIDLPFIIPYYRVMGMYNLGVEVQKFQVKDQFVQFTRYIYDDCFSFGLNNTKFSVEISRFYFIPLFLFSIFTIIKTKKAFPGKLLEPYQNRYLYFISLTLLFYIFLQINISLPFYQYIPFLIFVQFPWRLLSIITPISVILFFYYIPLMAGLIFKNNSEFISRSIIILILLLQIFWVGGNSQFYKYKTMRGSELRENMLDENLEANSSWEEYQQLLFIKKNFTSLIEAQDSMILYINDAELLSKRKEFDKILIRVKKNQSGEIVFNQLKSPFLTLKSSNNITIREGKYREIIFQINNSDNESYIEISKTCLLSLIFAKI